jgi:predicted DNA-binding transcriptional regulator AlpA
MEELKTAIGAMKQAEEALAKQGFILRWKVRVKANQGFFRNMVSRLIADAPVPTKKTTEKTVRVRTTVPEQAAQAQVPEAPEGATEEIDEVQPVTALNLKNAASYLGITTAGLYDLIKRGRIPAHGKMGGRWFLTEELDLCRQRKNVRDKTP